MPLDDRQKQDAIAAAMQVLKKIQQHFTLREIWEAMLGLRREEADLFEDDDGDMDAEVVKEALALRLYGRPLHDIEEEERRKVEQAVTEYRALLHVLRHVEPVRHDPLLRAQIERLCMEFGTMAAMAAMMAYAYPGAELPRVEEGRAPPLPDVVMDLLIARRSPVEDIARDLPRVGEEVAAFCARHSMVELHDVLAAASGLKEPSVKAPARGPEIER